MGTESINARGARDLAHIGDVSEMSQQMRFRSVYADTLRKLFADDPTITREAVMHEAVQRIREEYPDFKPIYDADYFDHPAESDPIQ
jgi:hypothetical protein